MFALPLVGGLIFCSNWNCTRWRVAREEGHRLYFRAVFWGALIFTLIVIVRPYIEATSPHFLTAVTYFKDLVQPMAEDKTTGQAVSDLTVTCILAMLTGWPLAMLLNLACRKEYWLRRAIKKDEMEGFLLDVADEQVPICVTMDDRKVYVGYVVAGFDPAVGRKSILILPLISGYRHPETHKVNFTTRYTYLYGQHASVNQTVPLPAPLDHLTAEDFITVLPVDRIASYRRFDAPAYNEFQKRKLTDDQAHQEVESGS